NETADPHQQASLRSSMDLARHVELDVDPRWVDALRNNNGATVGRVPAYYELKARLGWRPTPAVEVSLIGENLLQPHHPEYGFPGATREEIERSGLLKVTYLW
ncbi:MAG TPA: hypothetical protein VMH39_15465, partial [Gemmatimonadaceae bacterium]|nr:hypothetical protein [Gemmatimonadaceae bacterium]